MYLYFLLFYKFNKFLNKTVVSCQSATKYKIDVFGRRARTYDIYDLKAHKSPFFSIHYVKVDTIESVIAV